MPVAEHPAERLLSEHARALARRIAAEAAATLGAMREPLLSGRDSGLTSVWAEICAQVQGEDAYFWDDYLQLMRDIVRACVQSLSQTEQAMLWLKTEAGWDWSWEVVNCDGEPPPEHPGIDDAAVAEWIVDEFLRDLAESDDSPDVERFLAGGSDGDEQDESDDEELDTDAGSGDRPAGESAVDDGPKPG